MLCSKCGIEIEEGSRVCSSCGNPINNSSSEKDQHTRQYNLILTGDLLNGYQLEDVKTNLEKTLKLQREKLDRVFTKKNVLLKNA